MAKHKDSSFANKIREEVARMSDQLKLNIYSKKAQTAPNVSVEVESTSPIEVLSDSGSFARSRKAPSSSTESRKALSGSEIV